MIGLLYTLMKKTISLKPATIEYIQIVAKKFAKFGKGNFSKAIEMMVNEYKERNGTQE